MRTASTRWPSTIKSDSSRHLELNCASTTASDLHRPPWALFPACCILRRPGSLTRPVPAPESTGNATVKRLRLKPFLLVTTLSARRSRPDRRAIRRTRLVLRDSPRPDTRRPRLGLPGRLLLAQPRSRPGRPLHLPSPASRERPQEAYFGATGGGLWKTIDGGEEWFPVTDFKITTASVGAIAVAETDPDLVFIGTGETCIRGNILPGDGVYRSRDGGETWEHIGFYESDGISKIRIHPTDPDIVYVASFGKYGVPSEERGVFRSTDGGDSWETGPLPGRAHRRHRSSRSTATTPTCSTRALWEAFRKEYTMSSGGPGSGMFKSGRRRETRGPR